MLTHRIHKGILNVTEGSSTFKITYRINLATLKCQCFTSDKLCQHVQYYLVKCLNVNPVYMPLFTVPCVKEWLTAELSNNQQITGNTINEYCRDFLNADEGCCICMNAYGAMSGVHQCPHCNILYHRLCYLRWNKNCPTCRYEKDVIHGEDDVIWPEVEK
jgi:hypothetical protein